MEVLDTVLKFIEQYLPTIISLITVISSNPWAAGAVGVLLGLVAWLVTWLYGKKRKDIANDHKNKDKQRNLDDLESGDASSDTSIRDKMRKKREDMKNEEKTE